MTVRAYYEEDDGETYESEAEVPAMWKIDRVRVTFQCPVCGTDREHVTSKQPRKDTTTYCDTCHKEYHLRPLRIPQVDVSGLSLQEEVTYQLESVRRVEPFQGDYGPTIYGLPPTVKYAFFGTPPVIIQYIAAFVLYGAVAERLFTDLLVTFAFLSVLATAVLASYSFYRSVLKTIFLGIYMYYTEDIDGTFREFLYHVGNYVHVDPFGFRTQ